MNSSHPHPAGVKWGLSLFHKETKKWKSTSVSWGKERWRPLSPLLQTALQRPLFLHLCSAVQKILSGLRGTEPGISLRSRLLTRLGAERFHEQKFYVTASFERLNTSFPSAVDQLCWGLWALNNIHSNWRYLTTLEFLTLCWVLF